MLWKETKGIGCALRKVNGKTFVVVHYEVAGNEPGFFFDNVGLPNESKSLFPAVCAFNRNHTVWMAFFKKPGFKYGNI